MNPKSHADRKGVLVSALFGVAGCLAAWPLGEALLRFATPAESVVASPASASPPSRSETPAPATPVPDAPPPPPEFAARLTASGAKSGGVQVSLVWDDANDLDLHCVGPDGHDVYSATRDAPSAGGGRMDADANTACHNPTPTPVENIFWPPGAAPGGVYRVYVDGYEQCPGGPDVSKYRVSVAADGKRQEFEGAVVFSERKGRQLVHEFGLPPRAGTTTPSSPPGATAPSASPPETPKASPPGPHPLVRGAWAALVVAGLLTALVAGTNYRSGRRPLVPKTGAVLIAGGVAAGLAVGGLGGFLDRLLHASGGPGVGFVTAWALLGGILGFGVSLPSPRDDLKRAAAVGVCGGLLGAISLFGGNLGGAGIGRVLAVTGLGVGVGLAAVAGRRETANPGPTPIPSVVPLPPMPRPVVPRVPASPAPVARPPVSPAKPAPVPPAAKPVPPPAAPRTAAIPAGDACPECGRKNPGSAGNRHCMICDRTY